MSRPNAKVLVSWSAILLLTAVTAMAQGALTITTLKLMPAENSIPFTQTLTATGGTPPYQWTINNGSLPQGMTLSAAGVLSGTPTTVLNFNFTVRVTDSTGTGVNQDLTLFVSPAAGTLQRTGVLSQIASGSSWGTIIYLVNTSSNVAAAVRIDFRNGAGQGLALPVQTTQPGFSPVATSLATMYFVVPTNATVVIQTTTPPSDPTLRQGWADVFTTGTVSAFAVFRQTLPGGTFSEGTTSQLGQLTSSIMIPYDNTNGLITGVALSSPSGMPPSVIGTVYDDGGNQVESDALPMDLFGQKAFQMPTQFPQSANTRGFVVFQNQNGGNLSGLALRFAGSVFTSLPAIVPISVQ